MAGELPGAGDARKKRAAAVNNKKKLRWQDDKGTNKIYASGSISALDSSRTVADSVLKPGQEPVAIPTPKLKTDDKSADKYYANGGSSRVRGEAQAKSEKAARTLAVPPGAPKLGNAKTAKSSASLTVRTKDDVGLVLDQVVRRLQDGVQGVVVQVAQGDNQLLKRVRAALDLLVTREAITEEQYRDVRISYEPGVAEQKGVAEKLGVPQATETVRTEANEAADVDPLAFLNGEGDDPDDPVVDTSAVPPQEVDTTADPEPQKDFLAPEEDDESDAPRALTAEEVAALTAPPVRGEAANTVVIDEKQEVPAEDTILTTVPVEPAADDLPRRRSKRSGRGSS